MAVNLRYISLNLAATDYNYNEKKIKDKTNSAFYNPISHFLLTMVVVLQTSCDLEFILCYKYVC